MSNRQHPLSNPRNLPLTPHDFEAPEYYLRCVQEVAVANRQSFSEVIVSLSTGPLLARLREIERGRLAQAAEPGDKIVPFRLQDAATVRVLSGDGNGAVNRPAADVRRPEFVRIRLDLRYHPHAAPKP